MYTVNVLLSTYNGEKYISQLIDSVLCQENVNVFLTIRDDGSKDTTIDIIKSYCDSRIKFTMGKTNLGPAVSYLTMLRDAAQADFYAYCDQDDVWNTNKLFKAVEMLRNTLDKPALFMSTYDVVDENLKFLYKRNMDFNKPFTLATTLMFRTPSACVMVMNEALRKYLVPSIPNHMRMHDYWTLLVALSIGSDIYALDESLMKYRLHGNNTVGLEKNRFKKIKNLLYSAVKNKNERYMQAKNLYDGYRDLMDSHTVSKIEEVIYYRDSLKDKLNLLHDKDFRWNPYINTMFYIAVLLDIF